MGPHYGSISELGEHDLEPAMTRVPKTRISPGVHLLKHL